MVGVKGVWDCGVLSNARAPKLICDLWRIAFEAADRGEDFCRRSGIGLEPYQA